VNRQHLGAFVWLRWRLMANQWRRAGRLNAVLMTIVAVGALATAVPLSIGSFVLGTYAIPRAAPAQLMYAWDGLVVAFLFFWGIGLVTDLQRSDPLSLSKFLHLPVSVGGAFLLNYLSSLLRLSMVVFGPVMFAFALALVYAKGAQQLAALPLVAAFLLMVTALSYQFQGWLGSLMSNPRRRRTMVVVTTAAFVLIVQLPSLLNVFAPWGAGHRAERATALMDEMKKLDRAFKAKEFDATELVRRQQEVMQQHKQAVQQASRERMELLERAARLANTVLPVGWLPLGVMAAAEGHFLPSALGLLGMTLIGAASLRRAYRSTVGQYQGQDTNRKARPAVARAARPGKAGHLILEARLPGLSEPVSAIALGGFRSLLRSPEAKMALLAPLIMGAVFGSMLLGGRRDLPVSLRPLVATGAMVMVLFGLLQLMGNQFGFDRDGFRVFVLSAAPRRDILLGKNLAYAPVALGMALIFLAAVQLICPMRTDHLLAMVPQFVSMFLLFCALANLLSISAPIYLAAGSLNPPHPKLATVLLQLVMFAVLFPMTQGLALVPLGTEALLNFLGRAKGVPICLVLSLAECAAVILLYRASLGWLGALLQAREQRILEIVTNRAA
jgi:ABC-2 type transport system permease protein